MRKRAEREAKASGAQAFMPIAEPAVASAVPEISLSKSEKGREARQAAKAFDKALANAKARKTGPKASELSWNDRRRKERRRTRSVLVVEAGGSLLSVRSS